MQARKGRGGPWRMVGVVPYLESAWIVGLRPGAAYQFRIAARNGRGLSGCSSASALVTTNPNSASWAWPSSRFRRQRDSVLTRSVWRLRCVGALCVCGCMCAEPNTPPRPWVDVVRPWSCTIRFTWSPEDGLGLPTKEFWVQYKGGDIREFEHCQLTKVTFDKAHSDGRAAVARDRIQAEIIAARTAKDPVRGLCNVCCVLASWHAWLTCALCACAGDQLHDDGRS